MQISAANHIKKKNNYRHGYASRHCSDCNYFKLVRITGIGGADLGKQPRCEWIGIDAGKHYRINPEYICDFFDNTKLMNRLQR
jgi:glucose-6-phosphate isomerase